MDIPISVNLAYHELYTRECCEDLSRLKCYTANILLGSHTSKILQAGWGAKDASEISDRKLPSSNRNVLCVLAPDLASKYLAATVGMFSDVHSGSLSCGILVIQLGMVEWLLPQWSVLSICCLLPWKLLALVGNCEQLSSLCNMGGGALQTTWKR